MFYLLWRLICNEVPVLYKADPGSEKFILFDQKRAFLVLPEDLWRSTQVEHEDVDIGRCDCFA